MHRTKAILRAKTFLDGTTRTVQYMTVIGMKRTPHAIFTAATLKTLGTLQTKHAAPAAAAIWEVRLDKFNMELSA